MTERPESLLAGAVTSAILPLQRAYLNDEPAAVRALAVLRRDVTNTSAESWDLLYSRLPEDLFGRGDEPSTAELCFAAAVQLYAVHQQGRRNDRMHRSGRSFGGAVRVLMDDLDAESAVMRRFKTLGAASTWAGRQHHLRALITQLRGNGIPLDYGRLSRDLYQLQNPATADGVRQRWVRDVHRVRRPATDITNTTATTTEGEN